MNLPQNTVVAVADGEKLSLFRNDGDVATVNLTALPDPAIDARRSLPAPDIPVARLVPTIVSKTKTGLVQVLRIC